MITIDPLLKNLLSYYNGESDHPERYELVLQQIQRYVNALTICADIREDDLVALLPCSYYMDPPDCSSVTLLEQLQRMAKDAERYRKIRREPYIFGVGNPSSEELDATLDAEEP